MKLSVNHYFVLAFISSVVLFQHCVSASDRTLELASHKYQNIVIEQGITSFTEILEFGTRPTIPVAWGDYDNDGDLDLAVGNFNARNELFTNNGDGTFTRSVLGAITSTFAVVWGDSDNDGDLDLAVGNGGANELFINNGDGTFTNVAKFGANSTNAMAWGDFDNDGDLDMAVGNGILNPDEQNYLYINEGGNNFTEVAAFGILQSDSVAWGDFDNDGDLDLAVGNGGFGQSQQNYLYINNEGVFDGQTQFGSGDTASVAWGDYDNDGDLDLAVGNWGTNQQNKLYINNGNGTFTFENQFGARDTNTISWGDFDHDGFLDLAVGNGDFGSADQNYIYYNNGSGSFTEQAQLGLGSTDSLAWGDFDGDGDLDIASGNEHTPSQNYLYENALNDMNYLHLHLVGHFHDLGAGYSNRNGIGAKVFLYDSGFLGVADHLVASREIEAHGGFTSQNMIEATFGLPGHASVDVRILWTGSGGLAVAQDIPGVSVGQKMIIDEAGEPVVRCPALSAPMAETSPVNKSRYISFTPGNFGKMAAIKVTLASLHHPEPPTTGSPDFSGLEGQVRWVGPPQLFSENFTPEQFFLAAELQCDPYFQDWGDIDLIHVYGVEVVPSSSYDVAIVPDDGCPASDPLVVTTGRWGDVVEPFNPPSNTTQPTIADVLSLVDKWLGSLNPLKAISQLQPQIINPSLGVGIADVLNGVDAWLGSPYPYSMNGCP